MLSMIRPVVLPVVTALALMVPFCSPASAAVSIFIDKNDNGVFDAGDVDAGLTLKLDGRVETEYSIVVPEGAVVRFSQDGVLRAGKSIRVAGTVTGTRSLSFRSEHGDIAVGPRALVTAQDVLQMTAGKNLVIDNSSVRSYDVAMLESLDGNIVVNKGLLYGVNRLELNGYAAGGSVHVYGASLQAPRGLINFHVDGTLSLEQVKTTSMDFNATVGGGFAEIGQSIVRVAARTGVVSMTVDGVPSTEAGLSGTGSVLDLSGTKVYAAPQNVVMNADQLVGF
jgi:hypothetical protein